MIDQSLLKRYANAFVMYEIANHGVDPRETLAGTTMRIPKNEGYKYKDIENWKTRFSKNGKLVDKIIEASSETNLMDYHQENIIKDILSDVQTDALESALQLLYTGDDDSIAFGQIVKIVGGRFDVLSFIFFLKNPEIYLPVRSQLFDERFKLLGIDSRLSGNCRWDKYQEYNRWIKEVCDFLKEYLNTMITMIDAHSFLWVLPGLKAYLGKEYQLVEHSKFGKGTVLGFERDMILVKFGKEQKAFGRETAFDKGVLRFLPSVVDIYGNKREIFKPDEITLRSNKVEDDSLVSDLREDAGESFEFTYSSGPIERPLATKTNGHITYPRDRQTARNALAYAKYTCEVNPEHPTFLRKKTGKPYTEPHHLVPMAYQDQFNVKLDREQNIVSLCSNCHNQIHYGRDAGEIIKKLYSDRSELLESVGIAITLEQLLNMYEE